MAYSHFVSDDVAMDFSVFDHNQLVMLNGFDCKQLINA